MPAMMYYFGYCTFLNEPEQRHYLPRARPVTKGYAANSKVEFRGQVGRTDRGWCHIDNGPAARGVNAHGVVFEHPAADFEVDFDGFERYFLTVYGEDGKTYDCWTLRLSAPAERVRPPNFYWQHVPAGLKAWDFPEHVASQVLAEYEAAKPCLDPDQQPT
jgi:hypothetical protein